MAKTPTVKHTRYTVRGAKLGSIKSPSMKGLKSVVKMSGGLKKGKKTTATLNPLRMKAN